MPDDLEWGVSSDFSDISMLNSRVTTSTTMTSMSAAEPKAPISPIDDFPCIPPEDLGLSPPSKVYYLITMEGELVVKEAIEAEKLRYIEIGDTKYSALDVVEALNYGQSPLFSHISAYMESSKYLQELSRIWDRSLLTDFAKTLLQNKKDVYKVVSGVNLGLCGTFEDYMAAENVQLLLGVLDTFRGILGRANFQPPKSFIVRDLKASVEYLKANMANVRTNPMASPNTCASELESFWKDRFANLGSSVVMNARSMAANVFHLSRFMDSLLGDGQYISILNKAPTRWTKARKEEILIKRLQLQDAEQDYFREAFLLIAGVTLTDLNPKGDLLGPLDELKASNLLSGPFGVALTDKPSEHLTFTGPHSRSTVRLLNIKAIFRLYVPQRTGVARAAGMPTLFLELIYAHVLFFGRDKGSEKIGESLGVDMNLIRDFRDNYSPVQSDFQLQDFPIYATRLQCIQKKMNKWRPQTFRELAVRPYRDPLTFYAFWFATFVGVISIMGLGAGIVQAFSSLKAVS